MEATSNDMRPQSIAAPTHHVEMAKAAVGMLSLCELGISRTNDATCNGRSGCDNNPGKWCQADATRASTTALWTAIVTLLVIAPTIVMLVADLFPKMTRS